MMKLKFIYKGSLFILLEVTENETLQQIIRHIQINHAPSNNSSVALSFNGYPIATQADYLAANLTDGSEITLHFEELPESPIDFSLNEYLNDDAGDSSFNEYLTDAGDSSFNEYPTAAGASSSQPPAPMLPPPAMIRVVLQYGNARAASLEVAAAGNVSQLRTMLDAKVNIPHPYFFVLGQVPIDENRSFLSQNISERAVIKILESVPVNTAGASSSQRPPERGFMRVRYSDPYARTVGITPTVNDIVLQLKAAIQKDIKIQEDIQIPIRQIVIRDQSGYELADDIYLLRPQIPGMSELSAEFLQPPPAPTLPPPMIRVFLEYRNMVVEVEVAAAGKVSQLRTMLDAAKPKVNLFHGLYFFIHGEVKIDENRSFLSQTISEGAVIKILWPFLLKIPFQLKTPNARKACSFDVVAVSDETILELKRRISIDRRIRVDRILIKIDGIEHPDHKLLHACSLKSESRFEIELKKK